MANKQHKTLLSNAAATGSGVLWSGGEGTFHVEGTFNGSTITLQKLGPDGSSWSDVGTDVALAAAGMADFSLGPCTIRAEVVGGPPSGIYAEVIGTGR